VLSQQLFSLLNSFTKNPDFDMPQYIKIFNDILTPEICNNLIKRFDEDERVDVDPQPDYSTRNYLSLSIYSDWLSEVIPLVEASNEIAQEYFKRPEGLEESGLEEWMDDGFIMSRYAPGDSLVLHVDGQNGEEPNNGLRVASLVFFLNDCEGGETNFPLQKKQVKPAQGAAVIFPPGYTHPHEVLEAKTPRYIVQTWLTDPNYKVVYRN
jgi:prolyl 4-hydroxylase